MRHASLRKVAQLRGVLADGSALEVPVYAIARMRSFHDIEVVSDKGRVTLRGSVLTVTQRRLAEHPAHALVDTRGIDDRLRAIAETPPMGDAHALYRLVQDADFTTRVELQRQ